MLSVCTIHHNKQNSKCLRVFGVRSSSPHYSLTRQHRMSSRSLLPDHLTAPHQKELSFHPNTKGEFNHRRKPKVGLSYYRTTAFNNNNLYCRHRWCIKKYIKNNKCKYIRATLPQHLKVLTIRNHFYISYQVLPPQPLSLCNTSGKCHTEQTSVLSTEQKHIMIIKFICCLCVKNGHSLLIYLLIIDIF